MTSLKKQLEDCKNSHESLRKEVQKSLLDRYHDDGKSPNPMAKSMSWMKLRLICLPILSTKLWQI